MAPLTKKSFDKPDETRNPDKARVHMVDLGTAKAARFTMQPGWSWSESIKPFAGTDTCQHRHVGVIIAGSMHVTHADGTEMDIGAGEAYVLEPGHDGWVTSNEPVVAYEFESATAGSYAKG